MLNLHSDARSGAARTDPHESSHASTGDLFAARGSEGGAASRIDLVIAGERPATALTTLELVQAMERLNDAYRRGRSLIPDDRYDHEFVAELRHREPDHPFLRVPEPEPADAFNGARYRHTVPMLSIDKAYTPEAVQAFIDRAIEAGAALGLAAEAVEVVVTPKLDGNAGMRYEDALVTRGRNGYGTDVTHVLSLGVVPVPSDARGAGEIVIEKAYFDERIATQYGLRHPRNFIAGLLSADNLQGHHRDALHAGVCRFVSYQSLPNVRLPVRALAGAWEDLLGQLPAQVPYLCDGVVVAIANEPLRAALGSTEGFHRWMLALKRNETAVETSVIGIDMACGRTGRITPTLVLNPVELYGVTVDRATAHTAQHIKDLHLGPGAVVSIVRGGGVIPALVGVPRPAPQITVNFDRCPSCGGDTVWEGPYLTCPGSDVCPSQASARIEHFFHQLGTANGFGSAVSDQLVEAGLISIPTIYAQSVEGFVAAGISAGIARNLVSELRRSEQEPTADAVFLAAFGIRHLGVGMARRLLRHVPLEAIDTVTADQLQGIAGFGAETSPRIVAGLAAAMPAIRALLDRGFNLVRTPLASAAGAVRSPIAGMTIVFTGAMSASRDEMEARARELGATVGSSVTGKTSMLVCGANVGASKIAKATSLGVKTIGETEYRDLIEQEI